MRPDTNSPLYNPFNSQVDNMINLNNSVNPDVENLSHFPSLGFDPYDYASSPASPSLGHQLGSFVANNGSAIGGMIGGLFGPDPYAAYSQGMSGIPGMLQHYFSPYIKEGQRDMYSLHDQLSNLLNNPNAKLDSLLKGFHFSSGYQSDVNQAIQAIQRNASASGMHGTPAEQDAIGERVHALADHDQQNYLQNIMGLYGKGLSGLQNLETQGYGATTNLASTLGMLQELKAKAAEDAAKQKDKSDEGIGSMFGSLASGLAKVFI